MIPFSPRLIIICVALAALLGLMYAGYNKIYSSGAQSVQIEWDKDKAIRDQKIVELKAEADKKTFEIKTIAAQQQKVSNEKIANLNKSLATAIAGLSDRPSRPSSTDVPNDTSITIGATGAELYRPDAEFLIREATRAEKVRIQLETCTAQYNAVYEAYKK